MNIKNIIILLLSTGAGFVGGYMLSKNKYQKQADSAISEIKDHYSKIKLPAIKKDHIDNTEKEIFNKDYIKSSAKLYSETDDENTYDKTVKKTSIFKSNKEDEGWNENYAKEPYIISEDDSGTLSDYDVISLSLFKDDILADENDNRLSENEITNWLGNNVKTYAEVDKLGGAYYIRNETIKADIEIFTDLRRYSDMISDSR